MSMLHDSLSLRIIGDIGDMFDLPFIREKLKSFTNLGRVIITFNGMGKIIDRKTL